jgi:hypothetical protein
MRVAIHEAVDKAGGETGPGAAMTTLTLRRVKDDFVVTRLRHRPG